MWRACLQALSENDSFQRTFKEAFIRPGLNPERWGNRANYVALYVVPTGKGEMSIYHRFGMHYAWRKGSALGTHAGKPVRLTFALIDGDLYFFRFQ